MAIGNKSRLGVVAAASLSALFALGVTPASAANEGDYQIGNGSCVAYEKIALQSTNTGYHDFMAIDPIQNSASDPYFCRFKITDYYNQTNYQNNNPQWTWSETDGLESPWVFDGPGHYMRACVDLFYNGTLKVEHCGPLN